MKANEVDELRDSPAFWIEVAKRAYAAGADDALAAIPVLIEMEASGRQRIPACQWNSKKPWDIQDICQSVYDYWLQHSIKPKQE